MIEKEIKREREGERAREREGERASERERTIALHAILPLLSVNVFLFFLNTARHWSNTHTRTHPCTNAHPLPLPHTHTHPHTHPHTHTHTHTQSDAHGHRRCGGVRDLLLTAEVKQLGRAMH